MSTHDTGTEASADAAGYVAPRPRRTLNQWFDPRSNGGHLLYLLFSITVVLSHDVIIGGFDSSVRTAWSNGMTTIGGPGVVGFFVLGGFLIARSAERTPRFGTYVRSRALRIFPALLAILVVTAALFAPLAWYVQTGAIDEFPLGGANGAFRYVVENMGLAVRQYPIGYTLEDNPYPYAWNGSLWTLYPQFLSYLLLGVLLRARQRWLIPATAAVFYGATAVQQLSIVTFPDVPASVDKVTWLSAVLQPSHLHLMYLFFLGASLYMYREKVPLNALTVVLAGLTLGVAAMSQSWFLIGSTAWGYLAVVLLARMRVNLPRPFRDLSYGIYLTAFPIAQLYAALGVHTHGYVVYALASLLTAVGFAFVIKVSIEQPVRDRFRPRRVPPAPSTSAPALPPPVASAPPPVASAPAPVASAEVP